MWVLSREGGGVLTVQPAPHGRIKTEVKRVDEDFSILQICGR